MTADGLPDIDATMPNLTGAACKGKDPEIFFRKSRVDLARRICHGCPVRDACGAWATSVPGLDGVWGGMTAAQRDSRRRLRRRRRAPLWPAEDRLCDQCGQPLTGQEKKRHDACACGTLSGRDAHQRRGEDACQACLDFAAARVRHYRHTRQDADQIT